MQGGRANVGKVSVPLGGKLATRLSGGGQPQPIVRRPQAATPNVPRSGSREITSASSADMAEAGKVTGTPVEPVQQVKPVLNNANSV